METKEYTITDMMCPKCVQHIKEALERLEGVASLSTDLTHKKVCISYDPELVSEDLLKETVVEAGYRLES